MSSAVSKKVRVVRVGLLIDDTPNEQSHLVIPAFHRLADDIDYWHPRNLQFHCSFFNGEEGAYRGSANSQLPVRPLFDATLTMIRETKEACRRRAWKFQRTQAILFIFTSGRDVGSTNKASAVRNRLKMFADDNPHHIVCGIDQPCPATGKDCANVFGSIGILPNRIIHLGQNADGIDPGMETFKLIVGHALDSPQFIPRLRAEGIGPWIEDFSSAL